MRVILLEKLVNYGEFGDIVKVRPGYARNYLLPKARAILATGDNLKYFEERRLHLQENSSQEKLRAEARAEKFAAVIFVICAQADSNGKLFGSISVREIIKAAEENDLDLKKHEVILPAQARIRQVGEHTVTLNIHHEVTAEARILVKPIATEADNPQS